MFAIECAIHFELCSFNLLHTIPLKSWNFRDGCFEFKSHSLISYFPTIDHGFWHQIKTPYNSGHTFTCIMLSLLTLCFSIMSHATLVFFYHASLSTLRNSLMSSALWLPHAWYYNLSVANRSWWRYGPISFERVSFWSLFFDPPLTTPQSNIGVWWRKGIVRRPSIPYHSLTLLIRHHQYHDTILRDQFF